MFASTGAKAVRASNRLVVQDLPIDQIKASGRQQRIHSEKQLSSLMGSMRRFGVVRPILIDDDDVVLDGHAVLEAARRSGMTTIPAIRVGGLSPVERRALMMALNRIGESAKWDTDVLREDFQAILADPTIDLDIEVTGFDTIFVDSLLFETDPQEDDPVPEPEPGPSVSRAGDLWICGEHRIVCGDARDPAVLAHLVPEGDARLIIGDTPYNVRIAGNVSGLGKVKHGEFAMASGEMSRAEFVQFQKAVFQACADVSVAGSLHFYFIDWRHIPEQMEAGEAVFGPMKNLIVWAKDNGGMGAFYRSRHELITIWKKGDEPHVNNFGLGDTGRYRTNVWEYAGANTLKKGRDEELSWHPTVKPLPMIMDAILDVTHRGDIVLDPFGGSGTTLIAAERTGRRGRLVEIDPKYVDVTLRRWEATYGSQPVLSGTGQTFAEVAEERAVEAVADDFDAVDWSALS
jgi:DNA modification methylase